MLNRALIFTAALALIAGQVLSTEHRPWNALSQQERAALAPLAAHWDRMPASQQEKLLVVARDFPKLAPDRQKLLHSRLRTWSQLTAEERQIARDNFRKIQSMPKQDQASIRQQWLDSLCQEFGTPAPGRAVSGQ